MTLMSPFASGRVLELRNFPKNIKSRDQKCCLKKNKDKTKQKKIILKASKVQQQQQQASTDKS